ncbi:MAG TPA: trehalose-6-phosphate synthase [Candidatus Acidoferrales bacterium]|nr:trehalose-6-phosphate synthase [Candidatus Acidoferrales bacterium]
MRSSLRLILPIIASVVIVSIVFAAYQARTERRNQRRELERRASILAESLQDTIEPALAKSDSSKNLARIVEKFGHREHLVGIAIFDRSGEIVALTPGLGDEYKLRPQAAARADAADQGAGDYISLDNTPIYLYAVPLHRDDQVAETLVVYHDESYIELQTERLWRDSLLNILLQTLLIAFVALLLIQWMFLRPMEKAARWMRALRAGRTSGPPPASAANDPLTVMTREAAHIARNLDAARAAAHTEAKLRESGESRWTEERLRISIRTKLRGNRLFVVSNREPYSHVMKDGKIELLVPASGLVTALEPVMVASDGTWIAHGSGSADRETVDENDRLPVPPDSPKYTLRRVWLSKEEENGYYFGFSNEGLWPLCHTAHTRPIFRPEDWRYYQEVNQRFADAVVEEMAAVQNPVVLVQDYHFALVPRLIKEARPDARVAIFWHIPWPNAEVFGICPWQRELLEGLLGADLIGFHIQSHCNNFLETVDRALEALTEWDRFAVNRQGHITWVRAFPISVAFPEHELPPTSPGLTASEERYSLFSALGVEATLMGIGVDRVDYTKGIIERFQGIERFLEEYPRYQRRFTFVEIGAPSRTHIQRYQDFLDEVSREAERINQRFQAGRWKPIVFLDRHHSHEQIARYYRAADVCLVTSLHDGMNLVAKEFVAARNDEAGALILSSFTGAARELADALLVNPYDSEQLADAIRAALEMSPEDRKARMRRMRRVVQENNVYRWAGNLISDLCDLRIDAPEEHRSSPVASAGVAAGASR